MMLRTLVVGAALGAAVCGFAQTTAAPQEAAPQVDTPKGQVLFQSHGEAPEADADRKPMTAAADVVVSDRERAAVAFAAYDLEAHVTPATGRLAMRAFVTVRNAGVVPMTRVAMQVSSSLMWESAALGREPLKLEQHLLETDADHTGKANEAVITLPKPLAPGATIALDLFYSGIVAQSSERLQRIGAGAAQGVASDWDVIGPERVALRGFGNVLWYPVASVPLFLGDGNKLFEAVGKARLRDEDVTARLRLSVEYAGDAPVAAYFCGRRRALVAVSDNSAAPTADGGGVATAEFAAEKLGFRTPSLFVIAEKEELLAPLQSDETPLLAVSGGEEAVLPRLAASALEIAPMFEDWLGPRPLTALTILNQRGQPFEDGPLVVGPVDALASSDAKDALAHSLTHAWVDTGQPWMDEGLAQFFALVWTERERGREAAVAQMQVLLEPLALGEPAFKPDADLSQAAPGQPLVAASEEMFYRRKAAAVWWMLRDEVGDQSLKAALTAWRTQPVSAKDAREQAQEFERLLEGISHKDLTWFFQDWVLRDVGLPDLSIVDVTPRPLPAGKGHDSGWLVAVTVRNDGAATADVPLVVKTGNYAVTRRMRIAGFGQATERVVMQMAPTDVAVNDGSVPEVRSSTHTLGINVKQQ